MGRGNGSGTAVRVDVLAAVAEFAIRRNCFQPKELMQIGIGEKERLAAIRALLRLGVLVRRERGVYCVSGSWLDMLLFWSTGRRLGRLVREYLAELLGVEVEEVARL